MNILDPIMILATHTDLCHQLRGTLHDEERTSRNNLKKIPQPVVDCNWIDEQDMKRDYSGYLPCVSILGLL